MPFVPHFTDTAMVQNSIMQNKEYRRDDEPHASRLGEPEVTSVIMFFMLRSKHLYERTSNRY
jgi:hypothetical protein